MIGVLSGITIVLGLTPLGFIPIGPTTATIMHIPVIIGAIMGGPVVGGFVGLMFGLSSIFYAIMKPNIISFVFLNPLVSVAPRILIGLVAAYVYHLLAKVPKSRLKILMQIVWYGIAVYLSIGLYTAIKSHAIYPIIMNIVLLFIDIVAIIFTFKGNKDTNFDVFITAIAGTLTNTVLVLGAIYLFYGAEFVERLGGDSQAVGKVILTLGVANGIPETVVAIILTVAVVTALKKKN